MFILHILDGIFNVLVDTCINWYMYWYMYSCILCLCVCVCVMCSYVAYPEHTAEVVSLQGQASLLLHGE